MFMIMVMMMSVMWTCGHFTPCWRTCQQFAAISFKTEKKYGLTHSSNGTGLRRRQCDDDADDDDVDNSDDDQADNDEDDDDGRG